MLEKAWSCVKPGGYFVASFRLSADLGINDMKKSYQYINYDGDMKGELAPYVVLNAANLMELLMTMGARSVIGFGYYGKPSKTAITPYQELCFCALAFQKKGISNKPFLQVDMPIDIGSQLRNIWNKYTHND